MRKFASAFFAAILICLTLSLGVCAIEIDARAGQKEWEDSVVYDLKDQHDFLNGVKKAIVNIYFDERENCLYLLLRCEIKNPSDFDTAKLSFSVDGSDPTEISFSGETLCSPFETQAAANADADSGIVFVESVCAIKDGLDLPAEIDLAITDCEGVESNTFTLVCGEQQSDESDDEAAQADKNSAKSRTVKSKKSAAKKAGKTQRTTTAFPFSRATKSETGAVSGTDPSFSGGSSVVYTSAGAHGKTAIIIIGSLCAAALIAAGSYSAVKKNKIDQDDDTKQK